MANAEAGAAYVSIIPSMKGFGDRLGKGIKSAVSGVAKVGGAAFAAIGAGAIAAGKQALQSFSDYEQLSGGIEKIFGEAAGQVESDASRAYATAGLSANDYMRQVSSFSSSLKQSFGGDVVKAAERANMAMVDMSDNVNIFGSNMQDVQNAYQGFAKQNYTMLDNLKLGYGGTKEEMQRLIADANRWEKANGKAGDLSIEKFGDVVQAIHDIQVQQGIAGDTAYEAAHTIAGSWAMAKASFQNWMAGLGNDQADMGQLTSQLIESVQTVITNVAPRIAQIGKSIVDSLPEIAQTVATAVPGIAGPILAALGSLFADIAVNAGPGIMAAAAQMWQTLQDAIYQAQGQLLINFGIDISPLTATFERIVNAAQTAFGSIDYQGLQAGLASLGAGFAQIQEAISLIDWSPLFDGIVSGINSIVAVLGPCGERLQQVFADPATQQAMQVLVGALGAIADVIGNLLAAAIVDAVELFAKFVETVTSVTLGIQSFVADASAELSGFAAFVMAIPGNIQAAWSAIAGFFSGLWSGIVSAATGIWNGFVSFIFGIPGQIQGAFAGIAGYFSGIWSNIVSGARQGFSSLLSHIQSIPGQIVGFFQSIPSKIEAVFRSIHVPTLHVEGGFNLDPANFSIPHISFYAKGGIAKSAAVLGEAGAEAIVPYESANIRPWAQSLASALMRYVSDGGGDDDALEEIIALLKALLGKDTDIYLDGDTLVGRTAEAMDRALGARKLAGAR